MVNQYSREEFSRERAEALFKNLIEHKNSWETLAGSVGTIVQSGVIEDSELELKFIRALKTIAKTKKWNFEKVPDIDSYKYVLNIKDVEQNTQMLFTTYTHSSHWEILTEFGTTLCPTFNSFVYQHA